MLLYDFINKEMKPPEAMQLPLGPEVPESSREYVSRKVNQQKCPPDTSKPRHPTTDVHNQDVHS